MVVNSIPILYLGSVWIEGNAQNNIDVYYDIFVMFIANICSKSNKFSIYNGNNGRLVAVIPTSMYSIAMANCIPTMGADFME